MTIKMESERAVLASPAISVIVPVYNTEKYLRRCIDSILAQTFTDFELLLIDDGSTDGSGEICDKYARNYPPPLLRVFHKENGGVSSARNLGLDNARGEWVAFVDSDDWVDSNYLAGLMECSKSDLVVADFTVEGEGQWNEQLPAGCWRGERLSEIIEESVCLARFSAPWSKLLKRNLVGSSRFSVKLATQEDALFMYNYLCRVEQVQIMDNRGYHYNRMEDGTLSKSLEGNHAQLYDYFHLLDCAISDLQNKFGISRKRLVRSMLNGAMQKEQSYLIEKKPGIRQIYRELKAQRQQHLLSEYFISWPFAKRHNIYGCLFRNRLLCPLSVYVYLMSRLNQRFF